ncbi:MAG TPA: 3-isopropylmalate dehydrogenase [Calditrichae bacterium]|nr:3-isopropylmalate dehydrogenase [Calditrichia bacterium]
MKATIVTLPGDGIGPEVTAAAVKVLRTVAERWGFQVTVWEYPVGGASIDRFGVPLTDETLEICRRADAVLLGAVGGPEWDDLPQQLKPEAALLALRRELGVYANIRPVKVFPTLAGASSLKTKIIRGTDFVVVRELTGGIYFGQPRGLQTERGWNTMVYRRREVERIARLAFRMALERRRKVTSVDKANVLEVSRFWREVVNDVARDFPEVTLEHMYVDNAAMQLVMNPRQFDVILTGNMFGDILSDIGGAVSGSLGLLPSASLGDSGALYEPVHGSAPDIAGKKVANPIAAIASVALMFTHTFKVPEAAAVIQQAIEHTLAEGYCTPDIAFPGAKTVSTDDMVQLILHQIENIQEERKSGVII